VAAPAAQAATPNGGVFGVDTSQKVDWTKVPSGAQFAYIQAASSNTKGASSVNSNFYANLAGATQAGIAHGAYFYATPNASAANGATQAKYFYNLVGNLSTANPYTLPAVLDIEADDTSLTGLNDPTGCWNLGVAQTQNWIGELAATYRTLNGGVAPIIYTSKAYWDNCVGNSTQLRNFPLWIVDSSSSKSPALGFGGWSTWKFRQYALDQSNGLWDYDEFHGTLAQLKALGSPRDAGVNRFETGLAAALSFKPGVDTVFVADGLNYPDALAAGAAAGKKGGPVLLVPPTGALPTAVTQALKYLKPKRIAIAGGSGVVSDGVKAALAKYAPVVREAGNDRYATSATIATANFTKGVGNAYIAMGTDWPDALSGSALAATTAGSGPLFLVGQNSIPASVANALNALRPQKIFILGGTGVVTDLVRSQLAKYTASGSGSNVGRLSGADRYATSVAIAQKLRSVAGASNEIYAASGTGFPDALVGAPAAALSNSPLLLVQPGLVPASTAKEITALNPSKLAIMGGTGAVSASTQSTLVKLVG
jgi:putative cell wall-binding protein/GH25 family lysozyme M1 (1,4-beta-N-acetylmuramidase)